MPLQPDPEGKVKKYLRRATLFYVLQTEKLIVKILFSYSPLMDRSLGVSEKGEGKRYIKSDKVTRNSLKYSNKKNALKYTLM